MPSSMVDTPELPRLDSGVTLLETPDSHGIEAIQTLAIDHVLLNDGPGFWVDSGHHAVTTSLRDLAPSDRILDRINVARGFTPYQHTSLIRRLRTALETTPSLLVVPAVDHQYRSDDLRGFEGQKMLTRSLAEIASLTREHHIPVLVTREAADEFSDPVTALAEYTIEYHETSFGPRFDGDTIDTYAYDVDGPWVQTTWAFWHSILDARQPLYQGRAARKRLEVA